MAEDKEKQEDRDGASRGKGFPVIPLGEAGRILKEAGKYNTQHSLQAFAGYMGHETVNSGSFKQRFASFPDWKLVDRRGDRVVMTELGKRIAFATDPDAERSDLQKAFLGCAIFATLYESSAKGVALDLRALANQGVVNLGISAARKDQFAKSFAASVVIAGLAEEAGDGRIRLSLPRPASTLPERNGTPTPTSTGHVDTPRPVVLRQAWRVTGGEVVFEVGLDRPLPAAAFSSVQRIVETISTLVGELGEEEQLAHGKAAQ